MRVDALNLFNHPVFQVYPNNAGGGKALPPNFFNVQLPQNFWASNALSYDIRTLSGLQELPVAPGLRTNFSTLYNSSQPRYIPLGIRL